MPRSSPLSFRSVGKTWLDCQSPLEFANLHIRAWWILWGALAHTLQGFPGSGGTGGQRGYNSSIWVEDIHLSSIMWRGMHPHTVLVVKSRTCSPELRGTSVHSGHALGREDIRFGNQRLLWTTSRGLTRRLRTVGDGISPEESATT